MRPLNPMKVSNTKDKNIQSYANYGNASEIINRLVKSNSPRKVKPEICVNDPARPRVVALADISWHPDFFRKAPDCNKINLIDPVTKRRRQKLNRKRIQNTWQMGVSNHQSEKWAFSTLGLHEKRLTRRWHVERDKHACSSITHSKGTHLCVHTYN